MGQALEKMGNKKDLSSSCQFFSHFWISGSSYSVAGRRGRKFGRNVEIFGKIFPENKLGQPQLSRDFLLHKIKHQGRILAVWILPPKLPNSDLKIAVDFWVDFFLLFFPRKRARKNPPKNPRQNSPGNSVGKIPLGVLQKPSLDKTEEKKEHVEPILHVNYCFDTLTGPST